MPKLVRLYLISAAVGFGLAVVFLAALLALDVSGLRHLVLESQMGWIAGLMVVVGAGTLFSGVQFAISIMSMADSDARPTGGLRQHGEMIPVRVEAVVRKTRR